MTVLNVTPEQRDEARDKALQARRAQAKLLSDVSAGRTTLAAVLDSDDPAARRLRVGRLLRAVPGFGKVKADKLMVTAGVHRSRRVGGLGTRQRTRLIDAVSAGPGRVRRTDSLSA